MNPLLQHAKPRLQDRRVAPELVDDHALDAPALLLLQQHERPQERRKDAARIDVPHQEDRRIGGLGHGHVHDVPLAQVDFRRAPGPLQHNAVHLLFQGAVHLPDLLPQLRLHKVVLHGAHGAHALSHHDDLALPLPRGLEQNRVHAHVRLQAGRHGLHRLGPADFVPVPGHIGIEGHILCLEGRAPEPVLPENAQKGCAENALAYRGRRPLHHQTLAPHRLLLRSFDQDHMDVPLQGRDHLV